MKIKYVIINIVAIGLFLLGWFLVDLSIGSNNDFINGLQTPISNITTVLPFILYAIMTIIDINVNKKATKFGSYSRNTFFSISGIILTIGIVTTVIWFITGTTRCASGTWISWTYDYRDNLLIYVFFSVITFAIGLATNLYIWIISMIMLKIRNGISKKKSI